MRTVLDDARSQMNRIYRHQRFFYDLTRRYYLLGRVTLISGLMPPRAGSVLEVGCGTASNLIEVGRRFPTTKLYGFDVSTEMLATASRSIERAGLAARIALSPGDATRFNGAEVFQVGGFDRIFASYMLSMVPDWTSVLDTMARNLAPGGSIHIVDFGDCYGLPKWFRIILYGWLRKFHVTPRVDMHTALEKFSEQNEFQLNWKPLLRGYAQYAVLSPR